MIQRYIINKPSAIVTVDGIAEGQAIAVEWCKSEDVAELEAKHAKLNKHCLALFYAVCDLTHKDMKAFYDAGGIYAESIEDAKNAADLFANDPDFWHIVDIDDDEGEES